MSHSFDDGVVIFIELECKGFNHSGKTVNVDTLSKKLIVIDRFVSGFARICCRILSVPRIAEVNCVLRFFNGKQFQNDLAKVSCAALDSFFIPNCLIDNIVIENLDMVRLFRVLQHIFLFVERSVAVFAVICGKRKVAERMEIFALYVLPIFTKHITPRFRKILVLRENVFNAQLVNLDLALALIFNRNEKVFAERVFPVEVLFLECKSELLVGRDCVFRGQLCKERNDCIVVMLFILRTGKHTSIERLIQTSQRVRSDFTNQTANTVPEQEVKDLCQFVIINDALFIVIKNIEQEQINRRLIQLAKADQRIVCAFSEIRITVQENMVLLRTVVNFRQHRFIRVFVLLKQQFEIIVGFVFFCETVKLQI